MQLSDREKSIIVACSQLVKSNQYPIIKQAIDARGVELLKSGNKSLEYLQGMLKVTDYIEDQAEKFEVQKGIERSN